MGYEINNAYARFPHIRDDTVIFATADDIWKCDANGGVAERLTDDMSPVRSPRLSPDGRLLAYVSRRYGAFEIILLELETMQSARLTRFAANEMAVLGWSDNQHILFHTNAQSAHSSRNQLMTVNLEGRVRTRSIHGVSALSIHADGSEVLSSQWSRQPAYWKGYRGGAASQLWLRRDHWEAWRRLLPGERASLTDPAWIDDHLLFTSEGTDASAPRGAATGNVWALADRDDATGSPRQISWQTAEDGFVRDMVSDGRRAVWHSRGSIWRLDGIDAVPERIPVRVRSRAHSFAWAEPRQHMGRAVLDHEGRTVLSVVRGKVIRSDLSNGTTSLVWTGPGRATSARFLGHRETVAVAVDFTSSTHILFLDPDTGYLAGLEALVVPDGSHVRSFTADIDGDRVAVATTDGRLLIYDVRDSSTTVLPSHATVGASDPSFSSDGRFLTWSASARPLDPLHSVWCARVDAESSDPTRITEGLFNDREPVFIDKGRALAFISDRTFAPVYSRHAFDVGFGPARNVWTVRVSGDESELSSGGGELVALAQPEPLPVAPNDARDLHTVQGGLCWIAPEWDVLSRPGGDDALNGRLHLWSEASGAVSTPDVVAAWLTVSADGKNLLARTTTGLEVVRLPGQERSSVNLGPAVEIDVAAERQGMFDEAVRAMSDEFWREDMDGIPWISAAGRWRTTVDRVQTTDEFMDVIGEAAGELGTSHTYFSSLPPDHTAKLPGPAPSFLGVEFRPDLPGCVVARVLQGDPADPDVRSPLRSRLTQIREDDAITSVDGRAIDSPAALARELMGAAGRRTRIGVSRGATSSFEVVIPLADESRLRYYDWVDSRREHVNNVTEARAGYLHIPDMQTHGWSHFVREFRLQSQRDGLIVDLRYNRGGHVGRLIYERLATRTTTWVTHRSPREGLTDPDGLRRGPVVFLVNGFTGSDGDIFTARVKHAGIGTVVGSRTWGGTIGLGMPHVLVDGSLVMQPRHAHWVEGFGWGIENEGVHPDVDVETPPDVDLRVRDPELDKAVEVLLGTLRSENGPLLPPPMPPRRW